ncbi:MAG: hypothetical protein GWN59_06695 [Calditrichae bacterium]|nr:hypothetical protein [Calditrichia bacterium]
MKDYAVNYIMYSRIHMIARIIIGVIILAVGALMVIKTESFLKIFGRVQWAEVKLGGGSRLFYKLLGIVGILIGFLVITNMWQMPIIWIFGPLFGQR